MGLWLWCRPVATALIRPLAWELPYASGVALEKTKRQKKQKQKKNPAMSEMKTILDAIKNRLILKKKD